MGMTHDMAYAIEEAPPSCASAPLSSASALLSEVFLVLFVC